MIRFIISYKLYYKTQLRDASAFLFQNTAISMFLIPLGYCRYYQVKKNKTAGDLSTMRPEDNHSSFEFVCNKLDSI